MRRAMTIENLHTTHYGSCAKILPSQVEFGIQLIWYSLTFHEQNIWNIALEIPNELKMLIGALGMHLMIQHKKTHIIKNLMLQIL